MFKDKETAVKVWANRMFRMLNNHSEFELIENWQQCQEVADTLLFSKYWSCQKVVRLHEEDVWGRLIEDGRMELIKDKIPAFQKALIKRR